jgi:hypothetical protein
MNELDRYFDAYAEQSLGDEEQAALCAWLRADDAHVEQFARDAFLHWQLLAIGRRRSLQSDVSETPAKEGRLGLRRAVGVEGSMRDPSAQRRSWGLGRRTVAAVAAAIAMAATLVVWLVVERSKPAMVAQLTKSAANLTWSGGASPAAGAFLPQGQVLKIDDGRLLTTLASGVQIVLEGPAELRLDSPEIVFLTKGRMTVVVPREATGFVVDSRLGRFVDLGTEYTLAIDSAGVCQLHVFSGLVELRTAAGAIEKGPLTIPYGRAMSYDSTSGKVTILPYDVNERMSL